MEAFRAPVTAVTLSNSEAASNGDRAEPAAVTPPHRDLPRLGETLAQARLGELLDEVHERIEEIVATTRERMTGLLEAVLAVSVRVAAG